MFEKTVDERIGLFGDGLYDGTSFSFDSANLCLSRLNEGLIFEVHIETQ